MKKKIFALLLSTVLVASLLMACAGDTANDTTTDTPAVEETPDDPPADDPPADDPPADDTGDQEPVTITYSMWGDAEELRVLEEEVIPNFMSEFPWITVEAIQIDRGEYETWMNTMAAAGTLPDTGIMAESQVIPWAEQGMLLPVDINGLAELVGDTPLEHLHFVWEGETVAFSVCNNLVQLFYDIDKFEEAGVDLPPTNWQDAWTWDEFVDAAKSLTLDSAGRDAHDAGFDRDNVVQWGIRFYNATWMLEPWALANGGGWFAPGSPNDVIIAEAPSAEAMQMIADLYLVHGVSPQFGTNVGTIDTWLVEDTAMAINGGWSNGVWLGGARENEGLNFSIGVLPKMAEQATLATAGTNVTFATTEHPEAAAIWLNWYAQPENAWNLVEAGIWMPNFTAWYYDEDLMRRWSDIDYPGRTHRNHAPFEDYLEAAIEYSLSPVVHPAAWYWVNNMDAFLDVLGTVLAPVWSGDQTAQEALDGGLSALEAANRGQ
ncbi:MAG: extracellular solute-binding protein [Lachnospiraceae bacterium]|nr:extracellular solute-binding protein [Lachnospiraceae bacterium]